MYEEIQFPEYQAEEPGLPWYQNPAVWLGIDFASGLAEGYGGSFARRNSPSFARAVRANARRQRWASRAVTARNLGAPRWLTKQLRSQGLKYGSREAAFNEIGRAGSVAYRALSRGNFTGAISAIKRANPWAAVAAGGRAVGVLGTLSFAVPLAADLTRGVVGLGMFLGKDYSRLDFGGSIVDTQQAMTQRQAALAAIHNSQLQTRSMFAREAQAFHR